MNRIQRNRKIKFLIVDALVGNDYSILLCDHLQKIGVDITLLTTIDREVELPIHFPLKRWIPSKNPNVPQLSKAISYAMYMAKLAGCTFTRQFNGIHFQFFRCERSEIMLMLFLKLLGGRFVHTAHNVFPHERRRGDFYFKLISYLSSARIICHSETVRLELIQTFNIKKSKTVVIPHGNFDVYHPKKPISRKAARSRFNLSSTDHVLLFFGYIREYKGLDILLGAFAIAFRQNPEIRLLIAGQCQNSQIEYRYKSHIHALPCRSNIIFRPGFVPRQNIAEYFIAADWVMLPYRHIDHSGIIHLAYSYGRPVIATDVKGLSEMIAEDGTGYVTAENDPVNLAETIVNAIARPLERDRMGDKGKSLSETKYTWSHAAQLTKRVYEDVISQKRVL